MSTYSPASKEVHAFVDDVVRLYHPDKHALNLRVDVGFIEANLDANGDATPDPIKCNGIPVIGTIRITTQRLRARGFGAADLVIDKYKWDELSNPSRIAWVDQQITRLDIVRDKNGAAVMDEKMPKLKMRPYDIQVRGFEEVVRRHGDDAIEAQQIKEIVIPDSKAMRQLVFDFFADQREAVAEAA